MTTRHHTVDLLMNRIQRNEIDLQPGFQLDQSISEHTFNNDRVYFRFNVIKGLISEVLKDFS